VLLDPTDEELVSLGHPGRQLRIGIATAVVLLLIAIAKPWPGDGFAASPTPIPPAIVAAVATPVAASPTPPPTRSQGEWDNSVCTSPDGWRVVADDVELGRSVRAWLVANVAYSLVPPVRTSIPVTAVVSRAVNELGFCVPTDVSEHGLVAWSGTLWLQGGDTADPGAWKRVAQLNPAPGSLGAVANPVDGSVALWPPGSYVMEARFKGSLTEAWLGLVIKATP
jgi:hypothetical protein